MSRSNGLIYALIFGGGSSGGGSITPSALAALMEGTSPIAVDLNSGGTKVNAHFDLTGASAGQVPMVNAEGTGVEWGNGAGMSNPMTEKGDLIIGGSLGNPTRLALGDEGKVLTSDGSGEMSWQSKFATVTLVDTSTAISSTDFDALYSDYCYLMYDSKKYRKLWSGTVVSGIRGVIYYTINTHTGTGYPIIQIISVQDATLKGTIFSYNMPTVAKDDDDDYVIQFDENGTLKEVKFGTVVSGINDGTNWTSLEIDGVLRGLAVKGATLSGTTLTLTI